MWRKPTGPPTRLEEDLRLILLALLLGGPIIWLVAWMSQADLGG